MNKMVIGNKKTAKKSVTKRKTSSTYKKAKPVTKKVVKKPIKKATTTNKKYKIGKTAITKSSKKVINRNKDLLKKLAKL